ncbi:hypothetical protein ACN6KF_004900 [Labrys sp. La1]|uniref:hypothetical protein n=1 Tax=Labrys sp. La1 TaxID=3404917 RepID=UPI003EBD64DD
MSRWAYDLTQLAAEIRGIKRLKGFADAIDRFHSAFSLRADLLEARSAIKTLHQIHNNASDRSRFGAALMSHAVILYARATISDQDGRRGVDVRKAFSAELKAKHLAIADLRNTVVAHYGIPEGKYGLRWHEERTILKSVDGSQSFTYSNSRSGYLAEAGDDLALLIEHAVSAVSAAIEERGLKLQMFLSKFKGDPEVSAAAQRCQFNPENFYRTSDRVASFWDGVDLVTEHFGQKP